MPTPYCVTETPFNLTPTGFDVIGRISDDGGLPCSLYIDIQPWWVFGESYHRIGTDLHTGDTVQTHHTAKTNTKRITVKHGCINDDDDTDSEPIKFFLPRERYPTQAPPWLVLNIDGICCVGYYLFICTTDTACHLTAHWSHIAPDSVAKPHIKRGVTTWHDMYIAFHTSRSAEQMEPGDTINHTFKIPFVQNGKLYYWYLLGTIDGMESISVSPLFSASCTAPPSPTIYYHYGGGDFCENYSGQFAKVWGDDESINIYQARSIVNALTQCNYLAGKESPMITRAFLTFDTRSLPSLDNVRHAYIKVYPYHIDADPPPYSIAIQRMKPEYPHQPIIKADYDHDNFNEILGSCPSSELVTRQWFTIDILPGKLNAIKPGAFTILGFRIDDDITGTNYCDPTKNIWHQVYCSASGTERPQLHLLKK